MQPPSPITAISEMQPRPRSRASKSDTRPNLDWTVAVGGEEHDYLPDFPGFTEPAERDTPNHAPPITRIGESSRGHSDDDC